MRILPLGGLLLLAIAIGIGTADADSTAQSGEFSDGSTWNSGTAPTVDDLSTNTDIQNGHVVTVTSGDVGVYDSLRVGFSVGTSATLTIQGGTFVAAGNGTGSTVLGASAGQTGTLNVTSGVGQFNSQDIRLGGVNRRSANAAGIVNVSGGTLFNTGNFQVGDFGTGLLNVTGGLVDLAVDTGGLDVGANATAYGSINVSGTGLIQTGSGAGNGVVFVGGNSAGGGEGVLTIDGGTFSQNPDQQGSTNTGDSDFSIGGASGSNGTVNLVSGALTASRDILVGTGQGGNGFLNVSGGALTMDGDLIVGNSQSTGGGGGSYGEFNFSGGSVTTSAGTGQGRSLIIGNQGTGVMNVTGGDLDINGPIVIGNAGTANTNAQETAKGFVNQSGGLVRTEISNDQSITIGATGYGEYTITGGTLDSDGQFTIGNRTGNTVNQNYPAGTGVLTISGDDTLVIADSNFVLANSFENDNPTNVSEGHMNLNGGLATGGSMLLANRGLGFYNQTGGTLELNASFIVGDSGSNVGAASLPTPTIVAGSGFANITGGVVDVDDAFTLGDGNQGTTGGIQYQDSRAALGSVNVGGTALFLTNTGSAISAPNDNESSTEIGFNGTGFLTVSGGTFLSNHAGAIGTNGADGNATNTNTNPAIGNGINDGADVRLGVTNSLNGNNSLNANYTPNSPGDAPFGQLEVSGGQMIVARDLAAGLGSFATGNVIVSGGHLQVDGDIRLADGNDTKSTSSISGGHVETGFAARNSASNDGGNLEVGDGLRSSALLTISGGSTTVAASMRLGVSQDAAGTVIHTAGIVKIGEIGNGVGSVNLDILTQNGNNILVIGNAGPNANGEGAMGEYNLTGGTIQLLDPNSNTSNQTNFTDNGLSNVIVGNAGTGILTLSGTGRIDSQGSVTMGNTLTGVGMVTQTGGFLNLADPVTNDAGTTIALGDHLQIGNNGTAFYNITGGTIELESTFDGQLGPDDNSNRIIRIGLRADGYGSVHVGGTAYVHANSLRIGEGSGITTSDDGRTKRAEGIFTMSGGSAVFDGTGNQTTGTGIAIYIGLQDDSSGTLNVTGGHLVTHGDVFMADRGAVSSFGNRDEAIFGASEGFYNQSGGTFDIGGGSGGGDDFIVGNRGEGTIDVSGGVLNVDRDLTLGALADTIGTDTTGAGFGSGIATIRGSGQVNVGGSVNIGPAPGSSGEVTLSGSSSVSVGGSVVIGSSTNADAQLTQTGGVLIVDGELVTSFVEDASGTASGYAFSSGTLTRSTNDTLVVTGDLVITNTATVIVTGGTMQATDDPADPFSGFPDTTLDGIELAVTEGFAALDTDGAGNFAGAGVFDFANADIVPMVNGTTLQSGILWFASIQDTTGSSGGQNIADDGMFGTFSGFLDEIDLINIANLEPDAMRLTEEQFETMLGPGMMFDSAADGISYYALINGDGIIGFPDPRTGQNLGLAWVVAVPEPGSVLLVLLGNALFIRRRRARG